MHILDELHCIDDFQSEDKCLFIMEKAVQIIVSKYVNSKTNKKTIYLSMKVENYNIEKTVETSVVITFSP